MSSEPPSDGARRLEGAEAAAIEILDSALAGHYSIENVLGRGGMATVYLARDLRHHRQVAIKVLRADLVREMGMERFLRETEIAARLQHPNILPVFDSGDAGGLLYYIMPFVAGESVRQRLEREHQFAVSSVLSIMRDVAQALDYAHSQGIVHRDIKPANILLDGGRSLIADFGVARAIAVSGDDCLTESGLAIGTTRYMSPEQAAGQHDIDGRSDVYSLGCVVFEMLTGEPPFTAPTPQAVLAKHMQAPVPDVRVVRPTIGADTQQVLTRALAKIPADRFATAGDFARAFEASLSSAESRTRTRAMFASGTVIVLLPAVVLLLNAVGGGNDKDERPGTSVVEPTRVAVLYFDDLTPDSSLRHIADGLTEELIYELSGVNAFQVVPKSGVKQFRGVQASFDSMVRVLDANTVIDGSLQRAGDRIRVLVQLIDARTTSNIDNISLERHSSEFLTLGREVAQQVATVLRRRMGRAVLLRKETAGTSSAKAAELVLKARRARDDAEEMATHPHPDDRRAALENLARADSLLSLARAADRRWLRPILDRGWVAHQHIRLLQGNEKKNEAAERGLAFAELALSNAPKNAEAHELRGTIRWVLARDMDTSAVLQPRLLREAESDLRAALDQDSSLATAWATLSALLLRRGNFVEADMAAERAVREDAYLTDARQIFERLFYSSVWNGNLSRAADWCRRGRLSFPGYWRFVECELTLLREDVLAMPDADRAWQIVAELERIYTDAQARTDGNKYSRIYWRVVAAAISARGGDSALARAEIARARRATNGDTSVLLDLAYDEAYLRLALGERARADSLLLGLVRARPGTRALIARDPLFRELALPWLRSDSSEGSH